MLRGGLLAPGNLRVDFSEPLDGLRFNLFRTPGGSSRLLLDVLVDEGLGDFLNPRRLGACFGSGLPLARAFRRFSSGSHATQGQCQSCHGLKKPDTNVLFACDGVAQQRSTDVERQAHAVEELAQAPFGRFPVCPGEVTRTRAHLSPELARSGFALAGNPLLCVLVNLAFG
ncbi:hypothetical protein ACN6A1_24065 [Myxococcus virescens]|uniref:hypothetical protein n=1 Tax=Myxococcus virescens TaxID=83456 RepID=UPI003DA2C9E8